MIGVSQMSASSGRFRGVEMENDSYCDELSTPGAKRVANSSAGNNKGIRGWRRHPVGITIAGAEHADFEHWSRLTQKVTLAEIPSGQPDDLYGAEVFCLSCHRAHASPYNDAMRWNHAQKPQGCLECHTF